MSKYDKVLLFSGGLDSYILYHFLKKQNKEVKTVYFNMRHKYANRELATIFKTVTPIVDTTFNFELWEEKSAHIPFRNLMLVMGASRYAKKEIFIGGVTDDRVYDNVRPVHDEMTALISRHSNRYVRVIAPFIDLGMSKTDEVHWFLSNFGFKGEQMLLENTYSCYAGADEECMGCAACFRKFSVLHSFGIVVPKFKNGEIARGYHARSILEFSVDRGELVENYIKYSGIVV